MELYKVLKQGYGEHRVGTCFRANFTRQIKAAIDAGILQRVSPEEVIETAGDSDTAQLQQSVTELTAEVEKLKTDLEASEKAKADTEGALKEAESKNSELTAEVEKLKKKK